MILKRIWFWREFFLFLNEFFTFLTTTKKPAFLKREPSNQTLNKKNLFWWKNEKGYKKKEKWVLVWLMTVMKDDYEHRQW